MCGRYQRRSDKQHIAEAFALNDVDGLALELAPDYNVAPTTMQPVIVWDEAFGTRTLRMMFWRFLQRSNVARAFTSFLVERHRTRTEGIEERSGFLIATINGIPVADHWIARHLLDAGFTAGAMGFNIRHNVPPLSSPSTITRPSA